MPSREDPIQLVAPANIGQASDGTTVFHTGLWLTPSKKYMFIGLMVEGEPAARPKRPQIVVSDGAQLRIADFYGGGGGGTQSHAWVFQAEIEPEQTSRLAGATLTLNYEDLGLEHTAQITGPEKK
ncbi:hypothetical protein [Kribbella sp. NPDC051718]|uniref:hypothetical protein n=1 Tax=Kribbella sp. NPDC051718 TaxID=3155168 RepID=UPI003436FCB1